MFVLIKVLGLVLLADFLTGLFHWMEDAYGRAHWPITGRLITKPNILHHHRPAYFTSHSWFESAKVLLVMGATALVGAALLGLLTWEAMLVVGIGINANEIHKWAHRSRRDNGTLISLLQNLGIVQSRQHHAWHHQAGKNTHYCVVTNYVNPVLETIGLWSSLERVIYTVSGVRRRPDPSVAPAYRDGMIEAEFGRQGG